MNVALESKFEQSFANLQEAKTPNNIFYKRKTKSKDTNSCRTIRHLR